MLRTYSYAGNWPYQAVDIEPTRAEQVREHEDRVPDLVRLWSLEHIVVVAEIEHGSRKNRLPIRPTGAEMKGVGRCLI